MLSVLAMQCVIQSKIPITGIADYSSNWSDARRRLLVAVADGNVWIVTLPVSLDSGPGALPITSIVLDRSSSASNSGRVQWFCELSGVQFIQHIRAGLTSLTLMRSLVTPSTLIVSTRRTSESKLQRYQSLELDSLEGEQSTSSLCLTSQEPKHCGLLERLFPDVVTFAGVVAILQGDLDGTVRFSLVRYPCNKEDETKVSVIRSGTLVQIDQPVQMIIPFTTSNSLTPATEVPSVFNALLLLGSRGRVGAIRLTSGCSIEMFPFLLKKLELGYAVQSLTFVSSLQVFVFCSNGSAFVFRGNDVLRKAQCKGSEARSNGSKIGAEKLPFQPVRISMILLNKLLHTDEKFVHV